MVDFSKQFVLSLTDLGQAIKKGSKWILIGSVVCASLVVYRKLNAPLSYTAEGYYKTKKQSSGSPILANLLGGDMGGSTSEDDIEFLIDSPLVLEQVVQSLDLQGTLVGHQKSTSKGERLWKSFLVEKTYRHYGRCGPPSRSGGGKIPSTPYPIFSTPVPSANCHHIIYPKSHYTLLDIHFLDDHHFHVEQNGFLLGEGTCGTPFFIEDGQFTLEANTTALKGKSFLLSLVPKQAAVEGLKNMIEVEKDSKQLNLFNISFTHSDPVFAALMVNTLLEECQNRLKKNNDDKISNQVSYLDRRQQESLDKFELLLDENKSHISQLIEEGQFASSKGDESTLSRMQAQCFNTNSDTLLEMQRLYHQAYDKSVPLNEIVPNIRSLDLNPHTHSEDPTLLTAGGITALLQQYEGRLEEIHLLKEQCSSGLEKLSDEHTNSTVLIPIARKLGIDLTAILNLNRKLSDSQNWSTREQEQLEEQYTFEKKQLMQTLDEMKEGYLLDENSCRQRIRDLQKTALALLLQRHDTNQESLHFLSGKLQSFPDKWLYEQKLDMNKTIQEATLVSITNLVESKNISYHLTQLESQPYLWAIPPTLPNKPKLFLWCFIGAFIGAFLMVCFLCLREIYYGPTASRSNLEAGGMNTIGELSTEAIRRLSHHLADAKTIFCISKKTDALGKQLQSCLTDLGEEIAFIDLNQEDENLLFSKKFQERLEKKKEARVICSLVADPESAVCEHLANICEQTVCLISNERAKELTLLPQSTLYLFEKEAAKPPFLPIDQIEPLLRRLIPTSSSPSSALQELSASDKS